MPSVHHPRDLHPRVRHHQRAITFTWDLGRITTPWGPAAHADVQTILTVAWHPSRRQYEATLHRQHLFTLDGQDNSWRDVSTTTRLSVRPAGRFGPRVLDQFADECLGMVTFDLPGDWFALSNPTQGTFALPTPDQQ